MKQECPVSGNHSVVKPDVLNQFQPVDIQQINMDIYEQIISDYCCISSISGNKTHPPEILQYIQLEPGGYSL